MSDFFEDKNNPEGSANEPDNKSSEMNQEKDFPQSQQDKLRNLMPDYSQHYSLWDYRVGFGRRFGAALLDYLFAGIITAVLYYATGLLDNIVNLGMSALTEPEIMMKFAHDAVPVSLLVSAIYFSTEILLAGTPGKHLLGIIIADSDMNYASYSKLSIRFILKHIDLVFLAVYLLTWNQIFNTISSVMGWVVIIAFFFVFRASKEALYDTIAKTAVFFKQEVDSNHESKSINNLNQ